MHITKIDLNDGSNTELRVFRPSDRGHGEAPARLIVLWPGLGMGARYYDPLAEALAAAGCLVVSAELHGQGAHSSRASRKNDWGYHEMAAEDLPVTIAAARSELPEGCDHVSTYLLGHSMGGQIISLYVARPEADVDGAVLVAAGAPYTPFFQGRNGRLLRLAPWYIRGICALFGYLPGGRLGIMGYGIQARRRMREWSHFVQTGTLVPTTADLDYAAAQKDVSVPILSLVIDNDELCPRASAEGLLRSLPAAPRRLEIIEEPLGHNRWAREPQAVAERTLAFTRELEGLSGRTS